jgi:hypothetical protein
VKETVLVKVSKPIYQHIDSEVLTEKSIVAIVQGLTGRLSPNNSTRQATLTTSECALTISSTSDQLTCKRGRGRPKDSINHTPLEERPRRLGRPPGTGYLQKARALGDTDAPQKSKRPVGRPRKQQVGPMPVVSMVLLDGPLVHFCFVFAFHFYIR